MRLFCCLWLVLGCGAHNCELEDTETVLLQTARSSSVGSSIEDSIANVSIFLQPALTSTREAAHRISNVLWTGKFARSSDYILACSGLRQAKHENGTRTTWSSTAAGLAGAMFATLSITLADTLWMIPYITSSVTGRWNSGFFMVMCQCLATLAVLLAACEGEGVRHHPHMQLFIDVASALVLWAYAAYLYCEENLWNTAGIEAPEATPERETSSKKRAGADEKYSRGSFVLLALLNSVDQVLVYVPLVSTKLVNAVELEVGVLVSSVLTISVCLLVAQVPLLENAVKAIPLWLLVALVGVGAMLGGFVSP